MLHTFEKSSGQQVNVDKSSVFFSRNASIDLKQELCSKLHFVEAGENNSYLDLPSLITRNKSAVFGYIKEKLQDRIEGWDKKQLSRGAKRDFDQKSWSNITELHHVSYYQLKFAKI